MCAAPQAEILCSVTAYTAQPSSGSICAWPLTQYNEQAARSRNTDHSSEIGMSSLAGSVSVGGVTLLDTTVVISVNKCVVCADLEQAGAA